MNKKIYYLCFDLLGKETDNFKVETIKVMAFCIFLAIFLQKKNKTKQHEFVIISHLPFSLGRRRLALTKHVNPLAAIVIAISDWR